MNIKSINHNALRDRAYNNAVKHGWHEVDKPLEHWIMMIVTEMSEAIQADRHGARARTSAFESDLYDAIKHSSFGSYKQKRDDAFQRYIKDTLEDEFADIVIRSYDLAGVEHCDLNMLFGDDRLLTFSDSEFENIMSLDLTSFLYYNISNFFCTSKVRFTDIVKSIYLINEYSHRAGFDLYSFIWSKMEYNESRPYKHNLKY